MGNDFETTSKGFVDFLLLDEKGVHLCMLFVPIRRMEAKVKAAIDRVWGETI